MKISEMAVAGKNAGHKKKKKKKSKEKKWDLIHCKSLISCLDNTYNRRGELAVCLECRVANQLNLVTEQSRADKVLEK